MNDKLQFWIFGALFLVVLPLFGQEEQEESNIQKYTPSKLVGQGQWDVKWFNNLYTQTKSTYTDGTEPRETYFTSLLEAHVGIGSGKRWNVGAVLEMRSNVIADRNALDVFLFDGEEATARSGITSIAPSVKFVPVERWGTFSIQSSFFIPLIDNEVESGVFLDQKGFVWQNRFYYDHTFAGETWQLFAELNTELGFGKKEASFANNTLNLVPGLFVSYFPVTKFTILGLVQHAQRLDLGGGFAQDYTAVGGGVKYQLSRVLNIEGLYTNFVRGTNTGLGQTFNIGLRAIF